MNGTCAPVQTRCAASRSRSMTDSKDTPPLVLLVCIDALRYDCVN